MRRYKSVRATSITNNSTTGQWNFGPLLSTISLRGLYSRDKPQKSGCLESIQHYANNHILFFSQNLIRFGGLDGHLKIKSLAFGREGYLEVASFHVFGCCKNASVWLHSLPQRRNKNLNFNSQVKQRCLRLRSRIPAGSIKNKIVHHRIEIHF